MPYPGSQQPSSFYYVSDNTEASAPTNKVFTSFTCTEAGDVTFKAADDSSSLFKYSGGSYVAAGGAGVTIPVAKGMTIYGTFSSILPDTTAEGVAYVG